MNGRKARERHLTELSPRARQHIEEVTRECAAAVAQLERDHSRKVRELEIALSRERSRLRADCRSSIEATRRAAGSGILVTSRTPT